MQWTLYLENFVSANEAHNGAEFFEANPTALLCSYEGFYSPFISNLKHVEFYGEVE
jgi:hypothetical protein